MGRTSTENPSDTDRQESPDLEGVLHLRVLYSTNRSDAALEKTIRDLLKPERLTWGEASPRRLMSQCAQITQHAYDFVLVTEGWMDHAQADRIKDACRKSNIPIFYCGKGKPRQIIEVLKGKKVPSLKMTPKARWSGLELLTIEDLAKKKVPDSEIVTKLAELGYVRNSTAVAGARVEYFGIREKIRKDTKDRPLKNPPEEYHRLVQARRIKTDLELPAVVDPVFESELMPTIPIQAAPTSIAIEIKKLHVNVPIVINVQGVHGTSLIDTNRTLSEIIAFLVG